MNESPRVAFLTDSYHEVNGVAHTSRHFEAFAKRRGYPFLSVHGGNTRETFTNGSVTTLQLRRGRASIALDKDLSFDPLFWRQGHYLEDALRLFRPDVMHITGPSDLGILAAVLSYRLHIPLVASWHTNLHEYAGRRADKVLAFLPPSWRRGLSGQAELRSLQIIARFYRFAKVLMAPNQELIDELESLTHRTCYLMQRGVETQLFDPAKRDRSEDGQVVVGYVGRLTTEKNVRFLVEIEKHLLAQGISNVKFFLVGQGSEEPILREQLRNVEFAGVLRGDALARAYANMDIFAFPSSTDTFGNVVLEALASGVPAVVTNGGGPKFLVRDGQTGIVAHSDSGFAQAVQSLATDPGRRRSMQKAARAYALSASWDSVFERVYSVYGLCLQNSRDPRRQSVAVPTMS